MSWDASGEASPMTYTKMKEMLAGLKEGD